MRLFTTGIFITALCSGLFAGNGKYASKESAAYIDKYKNTAISNMKLYKIPASITLAQGILESGSGRSELAVKANNHFGIKCKSDYNGKPYYVDDDKKKECFRSYKSAEESFTDHSLFLSTRDIYKSLFSLSITDYKGWANGLKKCGYATNPKYPQLLVDIIEDNKLYVYDKMDSNDDKNNKKDDNVAPVPVNGTINGVPFVIVQPKQTLWSIASSNGLKVDALIKCNDFEKDHVLKIGEVVYLKSKKRKYMDAKYHIVQQGETMSSISQMYAVKLTSLRKRNKIKYDYVKVGSRVFLH